MDSDGVTSCYEGVVSVDVEAGSEDSLLEVGSVDESSDFSVEPSVVGVSGYLFSVSWFVDSGLV